MQTYYPTDFSHEDWQLYSRLDQQASSLFHVCCAITKCNKWQEIIHFNQPGGFMLDGGDLCYEILADPEVEKDGHSGCSLALTMRTAQHIGKHGWDQFMFYVRIN